MSLEKSCNIVPRRFRRSYVQISSSPLIKARVQKRLLLALMGQLPGNPDAPGYALLPGTLVVLALTAGAFALANLSLGDQLGASQRSSSREARAVAETGINEVITASKLPRNRGLLVAGQPMSRWSSGDAAVKEALRSSCVRSDGLPVPPGLQRRSGIRPGRILLVTYTYTSGAGATNERMIRVTSILPAMARFCS